MVPQLRAYYLCISTYIIKTMLGSRFSAPYQISRPAVGDSKKFIISKYSKCDEVNQSCSALGVRLLFALDNDGADIVTGRLVVSAVSTVTVRPLEID